LYRSSDSADDSSRLAGEARRIQIQARVIRAHAAEVRREARKARKLAVYPRLSRREADVLALLSSGQTTKNLAIQLGISINTANYHLSNVYRKLGTHNRVEAANVYFRRTATL
jgi:DNA-binding CsgD family transcriptional regulator